MCGIVFVHSFDENVLSKASKLLDVIKHRGPDNQSSKMFPNVFIGHSRLSIVDSKNTRANQPFEYHNLIMSYNGEIYNYIELRTELARHGYCFTTNSDTEVLIKAYDYWGEKCLNKLNGMWAFVIYDKITGKLFGSRDRYGIKPLYYSFNSRQFSVASELNQFVELMELTPNYKAIDSFLFSDLVNYNDQTFYNEIKCLQGGEYFLFQNGNLDIKRYYYGDDSKLCDSLDDILHDSLKLRMRSDVEIGSCLSGGLDSSLIVSIVKDQFNKKGFKVFHGEADDPIVREVSYAKEIANEMHHEIYLTKPSYKDFKEHIKQIHKVQGEPFLSPSIVMQYFVMKRASEEKIKVLLDGQGADEIFGGYYRYIVSIMMNYMLKLQIGNALKLICQCFKILGFYNSSKLFFFSLFGGLWSTLKYRSLFKSKRKIEPVKRRFFFSNLKEHSEYDIYIGNLASLLRYEDRNSMAFSIETRLPFLDYRLVELGLDMELSLKHNGLKLKWPIRCMLEKKSKGRIHQRIDKVGFEAPSQKWIKMHENEMKRQIEGSEILNRSFDFKKEINFSNYKNLFWKLYSVALWEDCFIKNSSLNN